MTAAAIALAESGGNPQARGVPSVGVDRGLWQINSYWHPEVSDACAYDPTCAAGAMTRISHGGTDFGAWATYTSGAYRQYLPQAHSGGTTATVTTVPLQLYGQGVIGKQITVPWWNGTFEVTQGYGPTDYSGEPEGHGYAHWHAGADIGAPCRTTIQIPQGISGTVKYLDNPGGYGTAIVLTVGQWDILFGHLLARLVPDGAQVIAGTQIALSNNTGNSTGCHIHFEVRPKGARYGNDVDPSAMLEDPAAAAGADGSTSGGNVTLSYGLNPLSDIQQAEQDFVRSLAINAQVGLGALLMLGGGFVMFKGLQGGSLRQPVQAAVNRRRQAGARRDAATAAQGAQEQAQNRQNRLQRAREQDDVIRQYRAGLIGQREAQRRLGLPERTVQRSNPQLRLKRYPFKKGGGVAQAPPVGHSFQVRRSRIRPSHQGQVDKYGFPRSSDPVPF